MFKQIFLFELKLWLKKPSTYIFFFVFFALSMLVAAAFAGLLGSDSESNTVVNSAYSITTSLNALNTDLISIIILISIIAPAVFKDFKYNMHPLLFTKPITKFGYMFGRFSAAFLVAMFVLSATVFGHIITCLLPGIDSDKLGAFNLMNYIQPFIFFIIPNTLLIGALFFSLVTFSRNMLAAYIGAIILLVFKGVAPSLLADLDNEAFANYLDPFGEQALKNVTKYWSPEEQNTLAIPFNGAILYNRLLWLGISIGITGLTFYRFKFSQFNNPVNIFWWRKKKDIATVIPAPLVSISDIPKAAQEFSMRFNIKQMFFLARFEFLKIVKSIFFIIIAILCVLMLTLVGQVMGQMYGTPTLMVTYQILELSNVVFVLFAPVLIIFYGGIVVWRERDAKVDELVGVTPMPSWVSFMSKLLALTYMQITLLLLLIIAGVAMQFFDGYYEVDILLYFKELFGFKLIGLILLCAMSMSVQVIFNQKFVGYFLAALILLVLPIVFGLLDWNNDMYRFNSSGPQARYSDMNGYGNNLYPFLIYKTYWVGFTIMLITLATALWVRGKETGFFRRFKLARPSFNLKTTMTLVFGFIVFGCAGSFIYYNTYVLAEKKSADEYKELQADYEKNYKRFQNTPQPRITSVNWNIDIFPTTRTAKIKGAYVLKNKTTDPIDSVVINFDASAINSTFKFSSPAKLVLEDNPNGFYVYELAEPLAPGASLKLAMGLESAPKGFKNGSVQFNGTFFNSGILPSIGYAAGAEMGDNKDRKKYGLDKKGRMAKVDDREALMNNYISSDADWIDFECTLSTSPEQIAMAPGYLQKEWEENGRRYFHYKMDSKILNFYSFLSADYEVKRDKWKDVNIEIYHHKGHVYNVDRMINAIKKSLDYYTKNFSPYQHRQVRILEFPRYAMFAQSFPNTIPFSEGIGFIAKVDENDPESIDYPFYVTAHEIAHQWWAHQVIGGNVEGATLMSETMSQYSALMVMEKEFGKKAMKKFLKYEMDQYLQGRAFERKNERPLMYVENQQYIHYNKGSVIMYALKDYIGEDSLNAALAKYIQQVGFQEPPYTNSVEFVSYLREATPDSLKYIIEDMFETITIFENKVDKCSYTKREDGKYLVKMKLKCKKMRADSVGKLQDIEINDWVDVAVFAEETIDGKKEEVELFFKKRKIDKNEMEFEIIVDKEPAKVGVDPYNKLVDRTPKNNTRLLKDGDKDVASNKEGASVQIKVGG